MASTVKPCGPEGLGTFRSSMGDFGKTIIVIGFFLVVIGVLITVAGKIPGVGKLPGDIFIKKDNFSFYFPLTTCLLLSIILTLLSHFFGRK
jgi:hypothetical protein